MICVFLIFLVVVIFLCFLFNKCLFPLYIYIYIINILSLLFGSGIGRSIGMALRIVGEGTVLGVVLTCILSLPTLVKGAKLNYLLDFGGQGDPHMNEDCCKAGSPRAHTLQQGATSCMHLLKANLDQYRPFLTES